VAFTTLRTTDCSGLLDRRSPDFGNRDRSARVTYNVKSDGATTIEVRGQAHIDVVRQVGALARREGLAQAHAATTVDFTVTNECGQVSRTRAFTSPAR
jgi:hypothetical protein